MCYFPVSVCYKFEISISFQSSVNLWDKVKVNINNCIMVNNSRMFVLSVNICVYPVKLLYY